MPFGGKKTRRTVKKRVLHTSIKMEKKKGEKRARKWGKIGAPEWWNGELCIVFSSYLGYEIIRGGAYLVATVTSKGRKKERGCLDQY